MDTDYPVFVTGNANKLKEVKAILATGETKMEITSRAIDCESDAYNTLYASISTVLSG